MTAPPSRQRLDQWLVEHRLAVSRSRARDLILRGAVMLDGKICLKPGQLVGDAAEVSLAWRGRSRCALCFSRRAQAGRRFGSFRHRSPRQDRARYRRLDRRLHASPARARCDSGNRRRCRQSQLAPSLREDARVRVLESQDARGLDRGLVPEPPELVTADVSFISLTLALPAALALAAPGAYLVALIKPQFEAGRAAIGKGGIVRSAADRDGAVDRVGDWIGKQAGMARAGCDTLADRGQGRQRRVFIRGLKDQGAIPMTEPEKSTAASTDIDRIGVHGDGVAEAPGRDCIRAVRAARARRGCGPRITKRHSSPRLNRRKTLAGRGRVSAFRYLRRLRRPAHGPGISIPNGSAASSSRPSGSAGWKPMSGRSSRSPRIHAGARPSRRFAPVQRSTSAITNAPRTSSATSSPAPCWRPRSKRLCRP